MTPIKNQREIENRMREAVRQDRARIQFSRISRFGLLELSRQRLRPSLEESSSHVCPMCQGQGTVRDTSSLALSILRLIEEEAHKDHQGDVIAIAPVEVATFILNEKRKHVSDIEKRHKIKVSILPDQHMMPAQYEVHRITTNGNGNGSISTDLLEERAKQARKLLQESAVENSSSDTEEQNTSEPAINSEVITEMAASPKRPAPREVKQRRKEEAAQKSLLQKILEFLSKLFSSAPAEEKKPGKGQRKDDRASRTNYRRGPNTRNGKAAGTRNAEKAEKPTRTRAAGKTGAGRKNAVKEEAVKEQKVKSAPRQLKNTEREEVKAADNENIRKQNPPRPRRVAYITAEENEAREKEALLNKNAAAEKGYKPMPITFISEGSGQGPDEAVPFSGATKGRDLDAGKDFEHSIKAGGFAAAAVVTEIEGISEPEVAVPEFNGEHNARDYDSGNTLEISGRPGGFNAATARAFEKASLTIKETQKTAVAVNESTPEEAVKDATSVMESEKPSPMPNPYEYSVKEEVNVPDDFAAKPADLPDPYANSPREKIDPYAHSPREVKEEVIVEDTFLASNINTANDSTDVKPAEGYKEDEEKSSDQN